MIKKLSNIFPYLLFVFFVYIPINLSKYDMWDGTIIEYAYKIQDFRGLKSWFFDSGWYFQYFQIIFYIKTALFFNIKYKLINDFSILLLGFLLIKEVKFISLNIFNISKSATTFSLSLLAVYPAWSTLLSSVLTFYFFCFVFGLISIRLLHTNNKFFNFTAILLILLTYNFNSLLFFLPILSYLYDINSMTNKYYPSFKTISIFIISIIYYIYFKIAHPPTGLYNNYNVISLDNDSIKIIFKSILGFMTFLIIPLFFTLIFNLFKIKSKKQLFFIFILFIAGSIPYIMVGRFVYLFSFKEWDYRHAILISLSLTIFFGFLYDNLNKLKFINLLIFCSSILITLCSLFIKLNRQKFETDLINVLKMRNIIYSNSVIQIIGEGVPLPNFRVYESNYVYYIGYNVDNNWVNISNKINPNFNVPNSIFNDDKYRLGYILNTNIKPNKNILIKISATGYTNPYDIIKNVLNVNSSRSIYINH